MAVSLSVSAPALPAQSDLPVERLAALFGDTTNSYKFFWFLALLDAIRELGGPRLQFDEILVRMVTRVWYPVNYFKLSFGQVDKLRDIVKSLRDDLKIAPDIGRTELLKRLETELRVYPLRKTSRAIRDLARYVPYRLVRGWFSAELHGLSDSKINGKIKSVASADNCLYFFHNDDTLYISPGWFDYVHRHMRILEDFCLWNLVLYLQQRNPNTPNVPQKMFAPVKRKLGLATAFWKRMLKIESVSCIYSGQPVDPKSFSLDHFIPWSFVTHDQMWNLVPTLREVNSTKSDRLPDPDRYFEPYGRLQHRVLKTALIHKNNKAVEDYVTYFSADTSTLAGFSEQEFVSRLHERVTPLLQIATNMGFTANWRYVP